jgi:C4-dicarboxylate-specific signal transduction histidine kinase
VLLVNSNANNERSSKIYEQSLVASISQFEYLPAILSTESIFIDALLHPEKDRFNVNRKLNFTAKRAGADAIYIMDIDGTVIATSNYNSSNSFLNKNYSFRPYFANAISERVRQFYYAKGATTGIPGFFISDPIIHQGNPIGVAVVKLRVDYWEENWRNSNNNVIVANENKIIILSSQEEWRYQSIGKISDSVIKHIKIKQQFIGKEHASIYKKKIEFSFFHKFKLTFWLIDKKLFLAHQFFIPEVEWTLYYLVKHDTFLIYTLTFFFIVSIIMLAFYLARRERRHKLESLDKNRQLELSQQEELKTVMDNIHVGVTLFSEKGGLVSINDHARHLLFDGEIPQPEKTIYIDEIIAINTNNLHDLLLEDPASQTYHEAHSLKEGNKNIPIMYALSKVVTMGKTLYLMTFINIKRRKIAEEELLRINNSLEDTIEARTIELHKAQETLMQKNKAAALGNMAATIVHELSQPLSAMNSSISAVCAKVDNSDWQGVAESANRLNPLSKKMYNVIKLLKYFSYQDSDPNNIINLTKVVEDSIDAFKDVFAEKGISHQFNCCNESIHVKANALKLDIVLSNIIKNAIDASENNTSPNIGIDISIAKKQVLITITDNGGGIDSHMMEKLFNPYFTTKEVGKGLGLGLSITYEIIQEYNGNITVHNTDAGASFTILLPMYIQTLHHSENTIANEKTREINNG